MPMNVAILTMSLNIGGAETHIYELACAVAAKGHNVTVFSAGGVYADKLKEQGISHIEAPLNSKSPKSLKKAKQLIEEYVKNNRPCVIHSHTRISNFTANSIAKKYNIPFVSTVHFNFSTGLAQRILTKWGDRALAVSEDLKNYAVDNYGYDRDKIKVTVNGINLNTFKKRNTPEFKKELGLSDGAKVILCVSRLDEVAGDHVERVLNMAKTIYTNTPESNIVIVGGGTRAEEFRKKADEINAQTKDGFIRFTGPQTDIYRFCNIADLFIGISRSALEAMACEVPTILLGNSGYLGLFSEKTVDACIDTNFTCRECPYPDEKEITDLVKDMLKNPDSYSKNVADGLEIVKNRYSVFRMADDAIEVYSKAERDIRPYDIMICGYYGRHNLGDDMALKALADNAVNISGAVRISLLSADAGYTPHGHISTCIHRFNLAKIASVMKKTRVFLLGSGSILQDSTSSRSIFYYLYIMKMAKKYGCKIMLYSNGIGPINHKKNRGRAVKMLEKADMITVRDEKSIEYLRSIGVENGNVVLTADETFTLDSDKICKRFNLGTDKKYFCINLRNSDLCEGFTDKFTDLVEKAAKEYDMIPVLLPLHFSQDIPILKEISSKLQCEHILIKEQLPHEQTLGVIKHCEFAIIERLHAIIFSSVFERPFMAVNYDPKVLSFCIEMGMEDYILGISSFKSDVAFEQLKSLVGNKDEILTQFKDRVEMKRTLAQKNAELLKEMLD